MPDRRQAAIAFVSEFELGMPCRTLNILRVWTALHHSRAWHQTTNSEQPGPDLLVCTDRLECRQEKLYTKTLGTNVASLTLVVVVHLGPIIANKLATLVPSSSPLKSN